MIKKILLLSEAEEFVKAQELKAQEKIIYNLKRVERNEIDKQLFKKLRGHDLWEFRTIYRGSCYRLLAFWDSVERALIVATHGIIKKIDKVPKKEIEKAEAVRKKYYNNKKL